MRLNVRENIWRWVWLAVAILVVMFAIIFARNKTPHKHPTATLPASERNSSWPFSKNLSAKASTHC